MTYLKYFSILLFAFAFIAMGCGEYEDGNGDEFAEVDSAQEAIEPEFHYMEATPEGGVFDLDWGERKKEGEYGNIIDADGGEMNNIEDTFYGEEDPGAGPFDYGLREEKLDEEYNSNTGNEGYNSNGGGNFNGTDGDNGEISEPEDPQWMEEDPGDAPFYLDLPREKSDEGFDDGSDNGEVNGGGDPFYGEEDPGAGPFDLEWQKEKEDEVY